VYTNAEELMVLVAEAQAGTISDRLVAVLEELFTGVWRRHGYGLEREDATQQCWVAFLTKMDRIETDQNIFGFLTATAHNELRMFKRSRGNYHRMLEALYARKCGFISHI
jgi:DNA-directed RNA polymerase specialized sigma24 family protein